MLGTPAKHPYREGVVIDIVVVIVMEMLVLMIVETGVVM
jgi:hypothetical protein